MEKRSISGKDILRMDGLLPPTRRLPVCNAVTSTDKKKEKKWSLGGILKRISSMRDYDSSSNDEEIVYCTRQPRPRNVFNRKSHNNVVLQPVDRNSDHSFSNNNPDTDSIAKSLDSSSLQRESVHRSSDGSLDGLSKKARKSKLKARIEAKRDRICADSSSDEDSRISCNSLTRYQNENGVQSSQKNSSCNRKSRAARTERYIKRLSRDEGNRLPENLNNIGSKRNSLDFVNERSADAAALQSQSFINYSNSNTFPVQRSTESLRQSGMAVSNCQARSSTDLTKHHYQYIKDLNQNNTYAKPNILLKSKNHANQDESLYSSPTISTNYAEPCTRRQFINQSSSPPEPPPRDPRFRAFGYSCNSFPFNGKYSVARHDDTLRMKMNDIHEVTKDHLKGLRSYDSSNEISWCGSNRQSPRRPLSLTVSSTQSCNLSECTNNRHHSTGRHVDEPTFYETEAMKCRRRNDRNEQLNSRFNGRDAKAGRDLPAACTQSVRRGSTSPTFDKISDSSRARSPAKRVPREDSYDLPNEVLVDLRTEQKEEEQRAIEQERRRSSKNLEEALSELEAIYNSLRLGDEDLLDRAERRSMEEFSLRQAKTSSNVPFISEDSSDRTKDDMAYRRMHPKERPTSLSEAVGQSALSNISYLIASPVLTRKDVTDDYPYGTSYPSRRDEPDVTRDDMVYRSIHHANNTLKVIDPQPPFGIPLGPVTTAPESDYLHTTPTKPDHPRSLYIPQCEPDIVTDDLAYRTLRKDANMAKCKNGGTDQETVLGTKKKRAVRSLSANLYGLINHEGIHLRREPSLQEITNQISDTVIGVDSLPVRSGCFRRVVSDGELSDYDTRWRSESILKGSKTDINGNHSVSNLHRKKLRVYVAPSTKIQGYGEEEVRQTSLSSNAVLSKALDNEFWQDRTQTKSDDSLNKDTDSDFTAYSRLCQDLVNLIEGPNDTEAKATDQTVVDPPKQFVETDSKTLNEPPVVRIQSLGSHYADDEEDREESKNNEDVERLTESLTNPKNEDSQKTEDSAFDFYLRVADENVKLIAEAFSSVADHLRDSRLSQKNSLTSHRSEIETDSTVPNTSTRSSVTYSPDDDFFGSSKIVDVPSIVPKEDATITMKQDQQEAEAKQETDNTSTDPELDLSKAVHDLQLAAASLCEHEKEIEQLEALLRKDSTSNISGTDSASIKEDVCSLNEEKTLTLTKEQEQEQDAKKPALPTDVTLQTDEHDPNSEGHLAHDHS